jgi:hypothetical protein
MALHSCPNCGAELDVSGEEANCPECDAGFRWVVGEGWMTTDAIEASGFKTDSLGYAVAYEIRQYVSDCAAAEGRSLDWPEMVTAIRTFLSSPRFGPVGCSLKPEMGRQEGLVLDRDATPVVRVELASPGRLRAVPLD